MNGKHPDLSFPLSDMHGDVHRIVIINNMKKILPQIIPLASTEIKTQVFLAGSVCVLGVGGWYLFSLIKSIITYPGVGDQLSLTLRCFNSCGLVK